MTRTQLATTFFIVLLVFVFYQTLLLFSPFFTAIFWAAIMAFTFYPLYKSLRQVFRGHSTLTALIMTFIILLVVAPPMVFLILNLASQAIDLYQLVSTYIREGRLEHLIDNLRASHISQLIETKLQWEPLKENATQWLLTSSKNLANYAISQVGTITRNIFSVGLTSVLVFFLLFIFLRDGEKIYDFVYQTMPLEEENKKPIFRQINDTFSAVIRGQLLTSLAQAFIAGMIYWVLGLPAPIFLAAATFIATLVPFVGAAGIWIPLCIYLFIAGFFMKGFVLLIFGILVISFIDNLLKPALIGKKTKLPFFLLFFGILGGLQVYGILGIFLGPLVLSLFFVVVKIYQEKFV